MARISKNQLIKLQKKYSTDESIGRLFGITRQAVHQLRGRYGVTPVPDKHKDRNDEVTKLYDGGMSGTKLARKYDLSVSQIYRIINGAQPNSRSSKSGGTKKRVQKRTRKRG